MVFHHSVFDQKTLCPVFPGIRVRKKGVGERLPVLWFEPGKNGTETYDVCPGFMEETEVRAA
jgi:hypothetical protein